LKVQWKGRSYHWSLGEMPDGTDPKRRSAPHLRARELLRRVYPLDRVLEEVYLPGVKLTADFVLPLRRLVVEVHGEQHYTFNPFFHGSRFGFAASLRRDREKADWCRANALELVVFKWDDGDAVWEGQLRG
jgi:hypothetical protein